MTEILDQGMLSGYITEEAANSNKLQIFLGILEVGLPAWQKKIKRKVLVSLMGIFKLVLVG